MGCGASRPAADQFQNAKPAAGAYDPYYGYQQPQAQPQSNYPGPSSAQYGNGKPSGYTQPAGYPAAQAAYGTHNAYAASKQQQPQYDQYSSKPQGYPQQPAGYPGAQPYTQYAAAPGYPAAPQPYPTTHGYPQASPPGYPGAPLPPGAYQQYPGAYQQYPGQGPPGAAQVHPGNGKHKRPGMGAGAGLAVGLLGGLAAATLVDAAF